MAVLTDNKLEPQHDMEISTYSILLRIAHGNWGILTIMISLSERQKEVFCKGFLDWPYKRTLCSLQTDLVALLVD